MLKVCSLFVKGILRRYKGRVKICFPESEPIFDMILGIHGKLGTPKSVEEYQQKLAPLTKQDVQHYLGIPYSFG